MPDHPSPPHDPLLRLARLGLAAAQIVAAFVAVGLLLVVPVMFAQRDHFSRQVAARQLEEGSFPWILGLVLILAAIAALSFLLLRQLRRLVASVSDGDPFIPANADRLRAMGWLALAIQALLIPMTRLAIWFDAAPFKPNVHHGDDGISLGLLALALLLFILARVFRTGTAMREELEGTV